MWKGGGRRAAGDASRVTDESAWAEYRAILMPIRFAWEKFCCRVLVLVLVLILVSALFVGNVIPRRESVARVVIGVASCRSSGWKRYVLSWRDRFAFVVILVFVWITHHEEWPLTRPRQPKHQQPDLPSRPHSSFSPPLSQPGHHPPLHPYQSPSQPPTPNPQQSHTPS